MAQRPGLGLPTVCVAMIPKRLSTESRAGMSRTDRNPGRATCNSQKRRVAQGFFPNHAALSGVRMSTWINLGGGGGQPFRPPHHLLHSQAPRVRGLLQRAGAKGEALVVAQGAVVRVGEGEGPNLGHGDRLLVDMVTKKAKASEV